MPKIKREYSIALMMIGAIALLWYGISYLKGLNLLGGRDVFYAKYNNLAGIATASPVLYNGAKVGQVVGIRLMNDSAGTWLVSLQIDNKTLRVTKGSKAEIYSSDFLTRAIRIVPGPGEDAKRGDTLRSGSEASITDALNQQIDPIKRKVEGMMVNMDSVVTALQAVLNVKAQQDIDSSLSSLRGTLENLELATGRLDALLASESAGIRSILTNLKQLSTTLAGNSTELDRIFANADSITTALADGRLKKMLADLGTVSEQLKGTMTELNAGEGTLGKLLKDDSLYANLNSASRELDLLLEDLRVNPNRYLSIFGKKDKLPKLSGADIERIQQAYQKQQGKP